MNESEYVKLPSGRPIVVTGSTGKIGHEIVRAIARLGYPMILPCRNKKNAMSLPA